MRAGNRPEKTASISLSGLIVWLSGRVNSKPIDPRWLMGWYDGAYRLRKY
jgi:hypothetical protein